MVTASRPASAIWPLYARGGLALVFGLAALLLVVLAVLMPGIVAALLLVLFGSFVLIDAGLALGRLVLAHLLPGERLGLIARAAMTLGVGVAAFTGPIAAGRPGAIFLAWPPGMIALTLWIVVFSAIYGVLTIVEATRAVRVH